MQAVIIFEHVPGLPQQLNCKRPAQVFHNHLTLESMLSHRNMMQYLGYVLASDVITHDWMAAYIIPFESSINHPFRKIVLYSTSSNKDARDDYQP